MPGDSETRPDGASPSGGDRAVRAGLVLAGILLLAANLRAGITAVGPVLDEIRSDLDFSGPTASLLISLPLIGFAVVSPLAAPVARRFGLDRTLGGSLLTLAAAIVLRSVPVPGAIWVGTALLGVSVAILNVLLPALVKREYPGQIGRITGIYTAIQSGFAAVAAGLAVPIAGATPAGWRLSLGIWAGLVLIGFAVYLPQIRRRAKQAGAGVAPVQPVAIGPSSPENRSDDLSPERPDPAGTVRLLSSLLAWQVTLFLGLQSTVYYVVITWWPTIEKAHGISAETAGWHQMMFQLCGIVGALTAAALIHRSQSQSGFATGFALLVPVAITGQLLIPDAAALWVVLLGIAGGATISIALSLFGFRTRSHRRAASLSGMAQSIGYILAACGPILFGAIHGVTGSWTAPLLLLLAVGLAEVAFGFLAGRPRFVEAGQ